MMMLTLNEATRRWNDISKLCSKSEYMDAIIELQAELNEFLGIMSKEDYTTFMYSLSDEEFAGSMIGSLASFGAIREYEKVLYGEKTVEEMIHEFKSANGMI